MLSLMDQDTPDWLLPLLNKPPPKKGPKAPKIDCGFEPQRKTGPRFTVLKEGRTFLTKNQCEELMQRCHLIEALKETFVWPTERDGTTPAEVPPRWNLQRLREVLHGKGKGESNRNKYSNRC